MIDKLLGFRETFLWKLLKILQETIIVIAASATCLLFVAEVVARYVLKTDFLGYDELVLLAVVWLYFIGGGYAMYKKGHINAEMLPLMLKGRKLQIARLFTIWATFVIAVVLVVWGVEFVIYSVSRPSSTTVLHIPKVMAQSSLVVGYALVAFYSLLYSIEDTVKVIRHEYYDNQNDASGEMIEKEAK